MNRAMLTAANSMNQLTKQFDIISHNIANSETTGYKRRETAFSDLIFQEINNVSPQNVDLDRTSPLGIRQGVGVKISKSSIALEQGPIKTTDRSLDIAFTNESNFLKVLINDGNGPATKFTRNGALYLSPTGNNELSLVTQDGYSVLDENDNPIVFSNQYTDFTITSNGTFQASGANLPGYSQNLGVITLNRPQYMEQKGDSYIGLPTNPTANPDFVYTNITGADRGNLRIQQNALEGSNVDLGKELTGMMNVQRSLQFQSKSISVSDQMMGLVNGIR